MDVVCECGLRIDVYAQIVLQKVTADGS
jgi:hypothetical protein